MPRLATGPHLWLRPERRDAAGRVTHAAIWLIIDGKFQRSTQCVRDDLAGAEHALQHYLADKHKSAAKKRLRDSAEIPVADVLTLYLEQISPDHARPAETKARLKRLEAFFRDKTLADINGELCRAFVAQRGSRAAAREDLSCLRAAINFHRAEGYHDRLITVTLPEKCAPRERWLTRDEAARLIWQAWRYREIQKDKPTGRRSRRHVARFILVALYTGTRAGAVCAAALKPTEGRAFIDVDRGIFYRRPARAAESRKRRPPVPLPRRLLAHVRRWKRRGARFCVEWQGASVHDVDKAFRRNADDCGMSDVTPHTLRHTAATWLMQAGADLWQAAGFLGMSTETLERNYGHHHPQHLQGARDALDRRPERKEPANNSPILQRNKTRLIGPERAQKRP